MHKPFKFDPLIKLLLDDDEGLGIDGFKLDLRKIVNLQPESRFVFTDAFDRMRNQQLLGWQGMVSSGADLGQQQIIMSKRNRVTVGCDLNTQFVFFTLDRSAGANIE